MTDSPLPQIESREELVSLLYQAAELEHGLCCSYLFASFSCKQNEDEGLTAMQLEAVERWRQAIKGVAEEEMLHLALVSNLLTAIGAAPYLRRPDFPQASPYYPAGVTIELRRLDDVTLTRFVHLERPEDVEVEKAIALDPAIDLEPEAPARTPGSLQAPRERTADAEEPHSFATVGQLYQAIKDGFHHLVNQRGEANVFIGEPSAQASKKYFGFSGLVEVTDLNSAREALGLLVAQGEGVRGEWDDAHYGTFLGIRDELRHLTADDPDFNPARPVLDNPLGGQAAGADPARTVHDLTSASVMELFDNVYDLMTSILLRFFARTDENDDELTTLAQTAVTLMAKVLDPLGGLLTSLPAGSGHAASTAGPSFAFHRSLTLVPHRRAAWLIFHERTVELAAYAKRLADQGAPVALTQVSNALAEAATQLQTYLDRPPLLAG